MSEANEAYLRRVLQRIANELEDQRVQAIDKAKRLPTEAEFHSGMAFQARLTLAFLRGLTGSEFGASSSERDSAVTS